MKASFAIPGDLETRTGGYGYARALIAAAPKAGLTLTHLPLPDGFPHPTAEALDRTRAVLSATQGPLLIDGLALGVLPAEWVRALHGPVIALCHHPLALETGLTGDVATMLAQTEAAALSACAEVIVPSPATARDLGEIGVPAHKLTVAPPGLERARAASRLGDPPVILSVGTLTPRKGHDVLIDALAAIVALPWHCVIAGPVDRDPVWAEMLFRRAAASGLSERVTFAGAQDSDGLNALYAAADIFCLPSRHEGYGMVFAEAMMRGLPVIAARSGAVPDLVPTREADDVGAAGLLVPPGEAPALGAAIEALLRDPMRRGALAAAARAHALSLPEWDDTARIVADLFRSAEPTNAAVNQV
ncbi:MAG: glycosyltransferase family 4 protein [Pseudomonadota bacterium]